MKSWDTAILQPYSTRNDGPLRRAPILQSERRQWSVAVDGAAHAPHTEGALAGLDSRSTAETTDRTGRAGSAHVHRSFDLSHSSHWYKPSYRSGVRRSSEPEPIYGTSPGQGPGGPPRGPAARLDRPAQP